MRSEPEAAPQDPQPGERIGRYEVLRSVARGGMATVLAVRDLESGEERGMKLLLPLAQAEEARTRFRREFRALSRLKHPGILEVFEAGLHGDRPWFTMELLEGRDLRDELTSWADLDPGARFRKAEDVLFQVTRALAYIHDRGLVHRDVTPGNVMVLPDGRVKIMDFGVVKDLGADLTQQGEVIGTVAYIAPEQIVGDLVDARADLYALGAVLYLMLTGKRPFQARTLQGYLEKHLHEAPRPPREVQPLVPDHLDRICVRLLAKDPADRYASAVHLLNVLGSAEELEDLDGRWPPRSVGRTYQKARIREALDDLAVGQGGAALLLTGRSGQGKTRLLDLADTYARGRGLVVARGRCRSQDRPFGAFTGVYHALSPQDAPAHLRAAMEGTDDPVVRERYPVISAFKDLLVSRAPCVVLLDDLEAADPATIELLTYLIRNTLELATEPVVFMLTHEAGAETDSLVERQLLEMKPVERLVLGPLLASEVEELVLDLLPNEPASLVLARRLHQESAGSPAFVADMMRALMDESLIVREEDRYRLILDAHEITRSRLPIPASLRQALENRLAPLPEEALEVARTLAVSRRRIDLDVLVDASDLHDEEEVMEALDLLLENGIAEERREGDSEQLELAQGRFRDVLLEGLDPEDLARRHQQLGEVLERMYRHQPARVYEELATHFEQAGLAPKAYTFLALTASRHLKRSLYEESLSFSGRALRLEPTARPLMLLDDADRRLCEIHLHRSQALYHLGDWASALQAARRAERLAREVRDPRLQARVLAELGNQLRNQGNLDEAEEALRTALARASEADDATLRPMPMYHLGALSWSKGDLEEADRLWRELVTIAQHTGDDRILGYGYIGLGILAICTGDTFEARSRLEQAAGLFEELGVLDALAIARVNLVELYLSTGVLRKALGLADRTVGQAREVNHPHGIALGLAYRAQVLLALGRHEEALRNAREALRINRELGTTEDEVVVLNTLVRVDLVCGRPQGALTRLEELQPLLTQHDAEGIAAQAAGLRATALALLDRFEEGVAILDWSDPGRQWPHVRIRALLARSRAWRLLGRPEQALEGASQALEVADGCGYRFFQLLVNHELSLVAADKSLRGRHARQASALARSLAANLPREDTNRFLSQDWGLPLA